MATDPNLATAASMSPDILAVYIMDELLERAERDTVFWNLAEKSTIPKGSGKTCQFTRYERLPLPEAPLEESVTPVATPITLSTVDAVLDQWGAVVSMSDVVILIIKHPLVQQARELLTLQHNELVDREVQVVAMGSTNIYFAAQRTSRSALTQADVVTTDDVRRSVARLRQNGAPSYGGGRFRGVVDPFVEMDISKDSTFQLAGVFSQVETLRDADIGRWMGVDWMRSNYIPIIQLMNAAWVTITADTTTTNWAGGTGFAAPGVRVVVTKLNPQTGFEDLISAESLISNAAAFAVKVQINQTVAPSGTYRIYTTLQSGATGTATLQLRVRHNVANNDVAYIVAGGAPTSGNAFVATGSGPVAPPIPPGTITIHISYIMGRGYLGATQLDALKTYVVPATASESDPLAQRTKAGWKQLFKALVLNPDFGVRIESASAFG